MRVTIDHSPAQVSSALALGAALVTVATTVVSGLALVLSLVGGGCLAIGLRRGSRRAVGLGASGMYGGVLVAGFTGAPTVALLVATVGVIVAWDTGENAITVGNRMGRAATTRRVEIVHAGASILVGVLAAGGGYLVFRSATGGQPTVALVALLFAVVVLIAVLRS